MALTAIVPMTLDVPVGMLVSFVVLLCTRHLDLLETPLREDRVRRSKVAAQVEMPEAHPCCQGMNSFYVLLPPNQIVDDFYDPVVVTIPNCRIAIAGYLVVLLRHWRSYWMRVQVATRR